jgi:hypothetical protein
LTTSAEIECIVVFRAQSSAHFQPEDVFEINVSAPQLDLTGIRLRIFTRWTSIGSNQIPRELIVEARGGVKSMNDALAKFGALARPLATMVGFVANVRVGPLEDHIAFECRPTADSRQFLEVFLPDEHGPVSPGGIVRPHLLDAACRALIGFSGSYLRLDRALRQYELALREWRVGGEWLALSHLWIAAENLTTIVVRKTAAERGISRRQLAHSYEIITDDPSRPHWIDLLGARIRQHVIFEGDNETYQLAKEASNGLEHGYLTLDAVAKNALQCTDKTFNYVRRTIISLLQLRPEIAEELATIHLRDVQSLRKVARGRLIGDADDPAPEGELYPRLEWTSSVDSTERDGATFNFRQSETMTIRTNPSVAFQLDSFELHGRLEDGAAPVQLDHQDVQLKHTPASPFEEILGAVMPLTEAVAASGLDRPHSQPSAYAFNLFGLAVSYFKGAEILIRANQPVEALPLLQNLAALAARFEQMNTADGPGLGIAVRHVLNSLQIGSSDDEVIEAQKALILHNSATAGLAIPDSLPPIDGTRVYAGLQLEMQIASHIAENSYSAVGPHLQKTDSNHALFSIAIEPGPFTNLIASATAIAMLTTIKDAASVFGWMIDNEQFDKLIADARSLNDASAQHAGPSHSGEEVS